MRILIYGNNKNGLENFCSMISLYPLEIIIDKASDYNDCIYFYTKHDYEKVFIDFDDDIGKKFLSKILDINPKQKVFILNNKNICVLEKNCEYCKENFHKNIIIKPLSQNQLTKILSKKFSCEYENLSEKEFNLEKIKKEVQSKYPYLKFDYSKQRDSFISDNIPTSALVFVTDLLSQYEIEFQVTHKNQIVIQ